MRTGKDVPFISDGEIRNSLETAKVLKNDRTAVNAILEKAKLAQGLTHREAAVLLEIDDPDLERELFRAAREVKMRIYGNRIVLFAPLYVSNYCVNECAYCGYKHSNDSFPRKRLSMQELAREVEIWNRWATNGWHWRRVKIRSTATWITSSNASGRSTA
jgi:2-iminoacetate synthase